MKSIKINNLHSFIKEKHLLLHYVDVMIVWVCSNFNEDIKVHNFIPTSVKFDCKHTTNKKIIVTGLESKYVKHSNIKTT